MLVLAGGPCPQCHSLQSLCSTVLCFVTESFRSVAQACWHLRQSQVIQGKQYPHSLSSRESVCLQAGRHPDLDTLLHSVAVGNRRGFLLFPGAGEQFIKLAQPNFVTMLPTARCCSFDGDFYSYFIVTTLILAACNS